MVKKKTKELQLRSSTPKKFAKTPPEPTVTPRKSPRLIAKATNNLNSSCRKVILDFGDDPGTTQPTQASVGDNLHVADSQGTVDLENDKEQDLFWKKASKKIINMEEAFKATHESVCNLENWAEDECHPEDTPWTQPLLYSDGEDATEWTEFCKNFKEVSGGGPSVRGGCSDYGDQEDNSEDDGYERLLETDDEAEVDQSLEIPNGHRQWFNDYEDVFGEDSLDNGELFPEDAGVEQVVEPGLIEVGTQFSDKLAFKRHLRAFCVQHGTQYKLKKSDNLRIRAVCKLSGPPINCQWFMYARKFPNEPTFSIKGFYLEHTCIGDPLGSNSSANPEFVAKTTYAPAIAPLQGPDDWEEPTIEINSPILMRKPGRPRVNRRRSYDEPKTEKKPRACSKCKQTGHNKTTCGVHGQTFTSINCDRGQSSTGKCKKIGNNNINLAESSQAGGSQPKTKKAKKKFT
ncbi:hypothetical protein MKW92_007672 [Papaver armeniacum]|nr:hypothetical protein MKW92_007672 [Papaver armeniacum]